VDYSTRDEVPEMQQYKKDAQDVRDSFWNDTSHTMLKFAFLKQKTQAQTCLNVFF